MSALPVVTDFLRTDDTRFARVPDFPYTPRYTTVGGLRIAHIDDERTLCDQFPRFLRTHARHRRVGGFDHLLHSRGHVPLPHATLRGRRLLRVEEG